MPLALSEHLSWFVRRARRYLYHDLSGEILEVDPVLAGLLADLAAATTPVEGLDALIERVRAQHPVVDDVGLRQALDALVEHDILVDTDVDELDALLERFPVKAGWRVVYHTNHNTDGVIGVIGRNTETEPREIVFPHCQRVIWNLVDGERSCRDIAHAMLGADASDGAALGRDAPEVTAVARAVAHAVAGWTHSEVQLARVSRAPMSFYRRSASPPPHIDSTMPFERLPAADAPVDEADTNTDVIDVGDYHLEVIDDPERQFDDLETTLSHLFRVPHDALQGRTYAAAVVDALIERGMLSEETREVLEVGGGIGFFGAGVLTALRDDHPTLYRDLHYRILDLSPALRASQRARLAPFDHHADVIEGNGEDLAGIDDASLDLVISNEVVADFRTARLTRRDLDAAADDGWEDPDAMLERLEDDDDDARDTVAQLDGPPEAIERIARYGIDVADAPPTFLFNLGAVCFVEQLARVLRPGGVALFTEFGSRWSYPVESTHLDHAEVSIRFQDLLQVAEHLGLEAELVDVPDLIGLDGSVEVLTSTRTWFRNFRALAARYGVELHKIAYTRSMLEAACAGTEFDPERVEDVRWSPLEERVHGLVPREFKAVLLRRPPTR